MIEEKKHLRDLGVEMASDLTFNLHIANVVTASNRLVGWALRTFRRRSKLVMLTIWKSLVQCKIDYTSQQWSPSDQASISSLESAARHFTAKIPGMEGLDCTCTHRKDDVSDTESSSCGRLPRGLSKGTKPSSSPPQGEVG